MIGELYYKEKEELIKNGCTVFNEGDLHYPYHTNFAEDLFAVYGRKIIKFEYDEKTNCFISNKLDLHRIYLFSINERCNIPEEYLKYEEKSYYSMDWDRLREVREFDLCFSFEQERFLIPLTERLMSCYVFGRIQQKFDNSNEIKIKEFEEYLNTKKEFYFVIG